MPNPHYTSREYEYKGQDATFSLTRVHSDSWVARVDSELVVMDRAALMDLRDYLDATIRNHSGL